MGRQINEYPKYSERIKKLKQWVCWYGDKLQKQVDKLLNRRIEPKFFHCHADALETCPKVQQAIKEFAEKVKEKFDGYEATYYNGNEGGFHDLQEEIDELLKEYEE